MSTSTPKQPSFRPLAEFLPKNDAGDIDRLFRCAITVSIHAASKLRFHESPCNSSDSEVRKRQ
jgi:hypothetical protein